MPLWSVNKFFNYESGDTRLGKGIWTLQLDCRSVNVFTTGPDFRVTSHSATFVFAHSDVCYYGVYFVSKISFQCDLQTSM